MDFTSIDNFLNELNLLYPKGLLPWIKEHRLVLYKKWVVCETKTERTLKEIESGLSDQTDLENSLQDWRELFLEIVQEYNQNN